MARHPGEREGSGRGDAPRTDLPPRKEPYDDGYFGTEEEENVVREEEIPDEADPEEPDAA
jgi:hypothetical protein